jgi:putative flippase GtrA
MAYEKKDLVISVVIGFLIGLFFLVSVKVVQEDLSFNWQNQWSLMLLIGFPIACFLGMLLASFFKRKFLVIYQIAKFGLVGALNTFIDFGVLNGLIFLTSIATGIQYSLFKAVSFLFAAVNSYFWNKHWTFEKKGEVFASGEFIKFMAVTFIGFVLNVGTATLIVSLIGTQYGIGDKVWANIGAFIAVFVGFVWNFIGSKYIVFKR